MLFFFITIIKIWSIFMRFKNMSIRVSPMKEHICHIIHHLKHSLCRIMVRIMVFSATFNNISVISWLSVLLGEEIGVPGENNRPVTSHWQTLLHNVVSSTPHHECDSNSQRLPPIAYVNYRGNRMLLNEWICIVGCFWNSRQCLHMTNV